MADAQLAFTYRSWQASARHSVDVVCEVESITCEIWADHGCSIENVSIFSSLSLRMCAGLLILSSHVWHSHGLHARGVFISCRGESALCLQIQWYEEVALVRNGRVLHVLSANGSKGVLPNLACVSPLAIIPTVRSNVQLLGSNIATAENIILARSQGKPADLLLQIPLCAIL